MGRWMRRHTNWWPRRPALSLRAFAANCERFRPSVWVSSGKVPFTSKAWAVTVMVADREPKADQ